MSNRCSPMPLFCGLLVFFAGVVTTAQQTPASEYDWFSRIPVGRSVVRAKHGMVASSQPLASQTGLEILKRGGNAVDAAIAMAAVLNVTEPNMTGIGGDAFMMVYSAKTKTLEALNASGRAPKALNLDYFKSKNITQMPTTGMETITVPGAFDGWVTLLEKHGTMKLAELLAPAIEYAENGFPLMEKTVADWLPEVDKLRHTPAAASTYLVSGAAPKTGDIFVQKNLARTFRTLAKGGRDALLPRRDRPCHRRLLPEERRVPVDGGFRRAQVDVGGADLDDLQGLYAQRVPAEQPGADGAASPEHPRGHRPAVDAERSGALLPHADRSDEDCVRRSQPLHRRSGILESAGQGVAVEGLRGEAARARSIRTRRSIRRRTAKSAWAATQRTSRSSTRIAMRCRSSTASSTRSDPAIVAGDTGIMLHNRGTGFSLDPDHPNRFEPGKRPFHTLIPAMVFKDGKLLMSYGVMGGDIQAQGHVQVLINLIDRGLNLQQAIDAPRVRYISGRGVMMEESLTAPVIEGLLRRGHERVLPPAGVMTTARSWAAARRS